MDYWKMVKACSEDSLIHEEVEGRHVGSYGGKRRNNLVEIGIGEMHLLKIQRVRGGFATLIDQGNGIFCPSWALCDIRHEVGKRF